MHKIELALDQIALLIDGKVEGDPKVLISTISDLKDGKKDSISFLANPKYESYIYETEATAVIVHKEFSPKKPINVHLIKVKDPYLAFSLLLEEYQRILFLQKKGIEHPVFLSDSVEYGNNLYLGAYAYIGNNIKIGNNVKIFPHVYIGDQVEIGDNTLIYPGVKILPYCKIGQYCTLQAGAVVGSDGFGFAPSTDDGNYKTVPQIGNVQLGNHVDIGANTTIDRATFSSTIIQDGVKIDNLVQIAHNVEIGKNTVIASQTGISGSTKIGNQVMIGGQVGVVGHIHIGNKVMIAAQSGISKNVPSGAVYFGTPAFEKTQYMKSSVLFRKLPKMMQQIQELEEKMVTL